MKSTGKLLRNPIKQSRLFPCHLLRIYVWQIPLECARLREKSMLEISPVSTKPVLSLYVYGLIIKDPLISIKFQRSGVKHPIITAIIYVLQKS